MNIEREETRVYLEILASQIDSSRKSLRIAALLNLHTVFLVCAVVGLLALPVLFFFESRGIPMGMLIFVVAIPCTVTSFVMFMASTYRQYIEVTALRGWIHIFCHGHYDDVCRLIRYTAPVTDLLLRNTVFLFLIGNLIKTQYDSDSVVGQSLIERAAMEDAALSTMFAPPDWRMNDDVCSVLSSIAMSEIAKSYAYKLVASRWWYWLIPVFVVLFASELKILPDLFRR